MTPSASARLIADAFARYHDEFRARGRAAAADFQRRDWLRGRRRATERLALYGQHMASTVGMLRTAAAGFDDRQYWRALRGEFSACVAARPDREIAETFFNSLTRRCLATVGVDTEIEFAFPERRSAPRTTGEATLIRAQVEGDVDAAIRELLRQLGSVIPDPDREARRVARALGTFHPNGRVREIELLDIVFYRNKAAYVVGATLSGSGRTPLLLAFLNDERGPYVDAVLTTADDLSIVFGFSWSYFLADIHCPAAVVAYLAPLMPHKRTDELYTSLGYNRHGKTELYRSLLRHLGEDSARFEEAEGARGLVMRVFTLPALNVVFKLIKDDIAPPKQTSWKEVRASYQFVFERDRVGRLADAQEFERLVVPGRCMPDDLLEELLRTSANSVQADGNRVIIRHCYTQRRVRPLNLYLEEASAHEAAAAVIDYGQALKDLAAADIFPGDMLIKNCGVSRHGRVIFYDFDELTLLGERRFRALPRSTTDEDELSADPWFSVGEMDVFPEQFAPFLIPAGPLADLLKEEHGELFDPEWWRSVQERLAAGEIFDTFPYPADRRLPRE